MEFPSVWVVLAAVWFGVCLGFLLSRFLMFTDRG